MKTKLNILKKFGAMAMAITLFFSAGNSCTVFAASSGSTVSPDKPGFGIVSMHYGNLNVRQYASTNSEIVSSLPNGSYIMIVGESGGFYKVQYNFSGSFGYVSKDYVEFQSRDHYLKVKNISGNLYMRSYYDLNAPEVGKLAANTSLAYVTENEEWYRGVYGNVVGSLYKEYVSAVLY